MPALTKMRSPLARTGMTVVGRPFIFTVLSLFLATGSNPPAAMAKQAEQTQFATEEIPGKPRVKHPAPLPSEVLQLLKADKAVTGCLHDNPLPAGRSLSSWFIASVVDLDGPTEADLVIVPGFRSEEQMCFQTPAGIGQFWVFGQSKGKYGMLLETWANSLVILKSRTRGHRDIETLTAGSAGRFVTSVTFHFNGQRYAQFREKTQEQH